MRKDRPVNLAIGTIHFPLAALTSITHRISGVIVFFGIAPLLWLLDESLSGEEGFQALQAWLQAPLFKLLSWAILSALAFHTIAGIKHLLLDLGLGESRQAASLGAGLTIAASLLALVLLGVWLW